MTDQELLNRALGILHRLATENKGWGWFGFLRRISRRWYYADEPLRNDAANLLREAEYQAPLPDGTQLVGTEYHFDKWGNHGITS